MHINLTIKLNVSSNCWQYLGLLFFSRTFWKLVEFFESHIDLRYGYYEHGIFNRPGVAEAVL